MKNFRAWLNIEEKFGGQEMYEVKGWDEEGLIMLYDAGNFTWDEVDIMQSTGLNDINGVEIYEGDCLSLIHFGENAEFKGEVVYSEGSFCMTVRLKGRQYKIPLHEIANSDSVIKVIGNIYENKELLGVKD